MELTIRTAREADIPHLSRHVEISVRGLQTAHYTTEQIESALRTLYGVDTQLVADGTYFVAEAGDPAVIAGCGGWSKRRTLYGGDVWGQREDTHLDPNVDAAKIRAFFIHPQWARRGVGSRILAACESAARAAGFERFEIGATLTGAALFGARGYRSVARVEIPLGNGVTLPIMRMEKGAPPSRVSTVR